MHYNWLRVKVTPHNGFGRAENTRAIWTPDFASCRSLRKRFVIAEKMSPRADAWIKFKTRGSCGESRMKLTPEKRKRFKKDYSISLAAKLCPTESRPPITTRPFVGIALHARCGNLAADIRQRVTTIWSYGRCDGEKLTPASQRTLCQAPINSEPRPLKEQVWWVNIAALA